MLRAGTGGGGHDSFQSSKKVNKSWMIQTQKMLTQKQKITLHCEFVIVETELEHK